MYRCVKCGELLAEDERPAESVGDSGQEADAPTSSGARSVENESRPERAATPPRAGASRATIASPGDLTHAGLTASAAPGLESRIQISDRSDRAESGE